MLDRIAHLAQGAPWLEKVSGGTAFVGEVKSEAFSENAHRNPRGTRKQMYGRSV